MKTYFAALAALSLLSGSAAFAQTPPDKHDDHPAMMMKGPSMMMKGPAKPVHADWKKGGHIEQADWSRGEKIDYRAHHLARPKKGYEWRQVDGNYVLAAAATGLIASIIVASH